jgi:N-acetyl-1-D-myo-inositol-2-amino-2-deoxy-alpha-D-glucopyranoside deacetylase
VAVVTCTLGEEGEVIGHRWAQLAADGADQLGGYRIGELSAALDALGAGAPTFLGGAGRWRDSGMADTPARGRRRFIDADRDAVGALVAVIRELRPHVVVTYDPHGGYGHPDHIHTHAITTTAAVAAAGGGDYPGHPWPVPKLYWTVMSDSAIAAAWRGLSSADLNPDWTQPGDDSVYVTYPDANIDAVIQAGDALAAKVAAMRAHATQVAVGPTGRAFALSNNVAQPILASEAYVLAAGVAGSRDARGWETDLLAGVHCRRV